MTTSDGKDKNHLDGLRDVCNFITKNKQDLAKVKVLHGAMAELATPNGLLSVTSMNQLVHNTSFSLSDNHISTLFHNVIPLLIEMNA